MVGCLRNLVIDKLFHIFVYQNGTQFKILIMIVISSREFRTHQKKYLDLVDNKKQVIIQRGKDKSYRLEPMTEDDRFFSNPHVIAQIEAGIKEVEDGDTIEIKKEDFEKLLGL